MPMFILASMGKNLDCVCLEANSHLLLCLHMWIYIGKMKYCFEPFTIWSFWCVSTANVNRSGTQLQKKKNISRISSVAEIIGITGHELLDNCLASPHCPFRNNHADLEGRVNKEALVRGENKGRGGEKKKEQKTLCFLSSQRQYIISESVGWPSLQKTLTTSLCESGNPALRDQSGRVRVSNVSWSLAARTKWRTSWMHTKGIVLLTCPPTPANRFH